MHDEIDSRVVEEWKRVQQRLLEEVGDSAYQSWLAPLTLLSVRNGITRLAVPTRFMRDWVQRNYAIRISTLWSKESGSTGKIEIVVMPQNRPPRSPAASEKAQAETRSGHRPARFGAKSGRDHGAKGGSGQAGDSREGPTDGLNPRYTFEKFIVDKSNELAYAAARRVAEAETVPFNPLFLYGGAGLGKTHLMSAIAWHIRSRNPERRIIFLSAEAFMSQFISALRTKDTIAFKEQFRSADVLMMDDVQFIAGREVTQEEFFHTFNALVDQNRQVVVSADKRPSELDGMEERMGSRLGWGLVADIHPTSYELRLGILQSRVEQERADIPDNVLEFLAHKITSNTRLLEGALNRIIAHASLIGHTITLELTQEVLRDTLRSADRRPTIEEIQKVVAEHYNIRMADMHSPRRSQAVARPRQVAMYIAKQLTACSLPAIGRKFGGRDHTTVLYAVRKVEERMAADKSFAEEVELLIRRLET